MNNIHENEPNYNDNFAPQQLHTVPQELRDLPTWVVWKRITKNGRPTKVPYRCDGKGFASSTDTSTWSTFADAQAAYQRTGYDGLGIGISGDIAAVDIDNCIDPISGLSDMAKDIMKTLNTYTELSPSGKGLRLLFKAPGFQYDKKRHYIKHPRNGLEVYIAGCTSRYVTITGSTLMAPAFADRSEEIATVLERYMLRADAPMAARPATAVSVSMADFDLVSKIRASSQGEMFHRLFDAGDTSAHSGDDSAADLALCNILAFWSGKNAAQMDALFRQGGLMRSKWDERRGGQTYGEIGDPGLSGDVHRGTSGEKDHPRWRRLGAGGMATADPI